MKKAFKIIIINNETGKVECEHDTDCIIAGIGLEEKTRSICTTHCDIMQMAKTLDAARIAVNNLFEKHPELEPLAEFMRVMRNTEKVKDADGDDDE